jgi:hypothetical protein
MHDENKGMWCSLCAEHMRKIGHLVSWKICHDMRDLSP